MDNNKTLLDEFYNEVNNDRTPSKDALNKTLYFIRDAVRVTNDKELKEFRKKWGIAYKKPPSNKREDINPDNPAFSIMLGHAHGQYSYDAMILELSEFLEVSKGTAKNIYSQSKNRVKETAHFLKGLKSRKPA